MKDIKPVAWSWFYISRHCTLDESVANELMGDGVDVSPLYALPEGYVIVPIEPTQKMVDVLKENLAATSRGGILRAGAALTESIKAAWEEG